MKSSKTLPLQLRFNSDALLIYCWHFNIIAWLKFITFAAVRINIWDQAELIFGLWNT